MVDDARLNELWRAFEVPGSSMGRPERLGTLFVPRERPQLVVCDPCFVAQAPPLALRFHGDTSWRVSILVREGRVVAAMATLVTHWSDPWPTPWPRTFAFERGAGERWEVTCDGAEVSERSVDRRGRRSSKTRRADDPAAALASVQARIASKQRAGFVEVAAPPTPPARWELASFESGEDSFPVDHASAMITDATSAEGLGRSPSLRAQLERAAQGPPGCAELTDGRDACEVAWFGSGNGDGRYQAYWGAAGDARSTCLIVPFI